jgi:hypothetical protein
MKTAFSSPEGCAVARRGRKNVEKEKQEWVWAKPIQNA